MTISMTESDGPRKFDYPEPATFTTLEPKDIWVVSLVCKQRLFQVFPYFTPCCLTGLRA